MKRGRKRKRNFVIAFAAALLMICTAAYTLAVRQEEHQETIVYKEETVRRGDLVQGIMESGSIELETKDQTYDIVMDEDSDDDDDDDDDEEESRYLKVEEVYVTQGQRIRKGDAIMKMTERSIRSVRRYLQAEASDAEIALEELQNEYEIEQVKAQNIYEESVTDSAWAQTQYDIDTVQIGLEIEELTNSIAVLEQEIKQIEIDLENEWDDYAELKEEYEKYERRYNEWDKDNLYTYIPLRTEYLRVKEQYDTETENRLDRRQEMADKQEEIAELREEIGKLQGETERKEMAARQAYETSLLDGSMAADQYTYSLRSLEQNMKTAREEQEELSGKLADFDAFVGEDGTVYAESDGLVTRVYYEDGDTIREESALLTYVQEDHYVLTIDISEEDIPYVKVGDDVSIVFTAYPDETYDGIIEEIVSTETSGTAVTVSYPVTVRIEGDTSKLYGGMTGDVTFVTDQVADAVYVSRKAVTTEDGKSYVLTKDESGEMTRTEVATGFTDGVNVQIVSGLSEGDIVYIESHVSEEENSRERERGKDEAVDRPE